MCLRIRDDVTAELVNRPAAPQGSRQDAVKLAVQAELDRAEEAPLRDRFGSHRDHHQRGRSR